MINGGVGSAQREQVSTGRRRYRSGDTPTPDDPRMSESAVEQALARQGVIDLSAVGEHPARAARRRGLVVVQRRVAVAETQPIGWLQHAHAAALVVPPPFAFLSDVALWAHGCLLEPATFEVGVVLTRGLSLRPPLLPRRVAPATLSTIVVRRDLPVVPVETAIVQSSAHVTDARSLALVERLLRSRQTSPARLRDACRRGLAGSSRVRAALLVLGGGDLELQKRRLRRALVAAGLTGLRSEVRLVSEAGGSCYLDLLHAPSRKALELDGGYHDLPEQRRVDRRRDRWVAREHGIEVIRIADEEVRRDLPAVVQELLALLLG
ncbi:MAG: hypothetical protein JWP11_2450 [Frankiales bacterium]|nr:hypothetical protein [Frankiales bacterium]